MAASTNSPATEDAFTLTRVFHAPRDVVWQAWTDPERLKHWWGPKGFRWVQATLDLRPGGLFHYCLRSADGREMWGKFRYHEILAPERLVFVVSFSDEQGGTARHPLSATWPLEVMNTLTLSELRGRTTLTLMGIPHNASEEERHTFRKGHLSMQQGFKGTLDQLEEYLGRARG
jgi:uncharacterized protein YndB with AHSA1/START domain